MVPSADKQACTYWWASHQVNVKVEGHRVWGELGEEFSPTPCKTSQEALLYCDSPLIGGHSLTLWVPGKGRS